MVQGLDGYGPRRSVKRPSADASAWHNPLKRMSIESWAGADHVGDSGEFARWDLGGNSTPLKSACPVVSVSEAQCRVVYMEREVCMDEVRATVSGGATEPL